MDRINTSRIIIGILSFAKSTQGYIQRSDRERSDNLHGSSVNDDYASLG